MAEDPIQELVVTPSLEQQTFDSPGGYGPVIIEAVTSTIDSDIRSNNIKKGVSILGVEGSLVGLEGEDISYQFTSPEDHTFHPSEGKNCITSLTISVKNEDKGNISPTAFEQRIYPSEGFSGINSATLLPVTAAIDSNIKPENIRSGINILGVQGTLIERIAETETYQLRSSEETYMPLGYNCFSQVTVYPQIRPTYSVSPRTSQQVITPSSEAGMGRINLGAVTPAIDGNIASFNIRAGVSILGVQGSIVVEDGLNREITAQGVLQMPSSNFSFVLPSTATDISASGMDSAFGQCSSLTSVDLSSLTTISGSYAMQYAFNLCSKLTSVDLSSLTTISGSYAMQYALENCSKLTSVDLSSLTTISGEFAMQHAFYGCTSLASIDLSSLTTISGFAGMQHAFQGCTSLTTIDLSNLTTISGISGMQHAFQGCTQLKSLSFPALTSTSFGSITNQFNDMLQGVTGCTVHFPSNLQSVIGSWSSVTSGFGGTNTTVLFDLPATT